MKLSAKIPIAVIPLIAGPLLLVGLLSYGELKDSAEHRGHEAIEVLLSGIENQFQQIVATASANVAIFADDPLVKSYALTDDPDERYSLMQRPLQQKLSSIQRVYPEYYEIRVLAPDGFEDLRLINRDVPNLTEEEANNPGFVAMQQAQADTLARISLNPDTHELALYVSQRLRMINPATDSFSTVPKLRGYLSLTINLDPVLKRLSPSPWAQGGILLTDAQGKVFAASAGFAYAQLLNGHSLVKGIKTGSRQELSQFGSQLFHHHNWQLHPNLWVHLLQPEDELLSESRQIGLLVLVVSFIAIVLSIPLLLILFRTQLLRPIQRLNLALASLGQQQQLIQVPIQNNDEIGELSRSFNRMSQTLQQSNEKIRTLAFRDSLTGLPNRLMFTRTLRREIEAARQHKYQIAVMFLDLDNFKQVNDTLGHPAGDQLLIKVAELIQTNLRAYDCLSRPGADDASAELSRFGGDEFTLLLRYLKDAQGAIPVAERIIEALSHAIIVNDTPCYAGCSIGIAICPDDGHIGDDLIKHADLAMYQAKAARRGSYQFFSKTTAEHALKRVQMTHRLRQAVEKREFILHYQPIIDSRSLEMVAVEALIRWTDTELGPVSPAEFIPLAEENGLILPIGHWVLEEAARQQRAWQQAKLPPVRIAVNVSSIQLQQPDFAKQITLLLRKYQLATADLYIELTETALIQGQEQVLENLYHLNTLGIQIALDDFGTGYSSLSYLQNLPIDILKIDRSFIINLQENNNGLILSAIITMAHSLNMKVVAEGVEDENHLAFLNAEGCDLLQGYLFGRPCPAADIAHLLLNAQPAEQPALTTT